MSPGDTLYVGRYLTLGASSQPTGRGTKSEGQSAGQPGPAAQSSGQSGDDPGQASLLALRVLSVSPPDIVCEAANAAVLSGLLTVSHPGAARRRCAGPRAAADGADSDAWWAVAAPAQDGGIGREGAAAFGCDPDGSANYSLPILSASDVAALKARCRLGWSHCRSRAGRGPRCGAVCLGGCLRPCFLCAKRGSEKAASST